MAKPAPARTKVRCAIYTRKSTEDGLDQEYNSLDAQHDACAAYVLSQRHEGWTLLPERYDDGGFSGGNMERPGLTRLLADVAAGKVDTIVIYKVDRLTRSLSDFAKIVEVLDKADASFVSITQSFNTTTSMGRLTLNMLLSFAQFEREVTGERIRDKIAASKRKGLWMGGPVPLGYEVQERKLIVNEAEAELVRHIFQRYIALPSVNQLAAELWRDGHRTKVQVRTSGPHRGGCEFRRGTLYHLLANRIYCGMIVHKGEAHPGEHEAIVPQALWDDVQDKLAQRGPGLLIPRLASTSGPLLTGMIYDGLGRPMSPTHSKKGSRRYRYYATREATKDSPAWRVRADDLERIITSRIQALLLDRNRIGRLAVQVDPRATERTIAAAALLAQNQSQLNNLTGLGVTRIDLSEERLTITLAVHLLLETLGLEGVDVEHSPLSIDAPVERVRRGHELRLVIPAEGDQPSPHSRDEKLIALIAEAHQARKLVLSYEKSISRIAADTGRCRTRLSKLIAIAHLAPDLVEAALDGTQPDGLTSRTLLDTDLPLSWAEQRRILSAA